jgi:hypothetical protein
VICAPNDVTVDDTQSFMNSGLRQRPRKAVREILCNRSTGNFILHLARAAECGTDHTPHERAATQTEATLRER